LSGAFRSRSGHVRPYSLVPMPRRSVASRGLSRAGCAATTDASTRV